MIKRRGYRIELGEIEAALLRHEHISQAAVVAFFDRSGDTRIVAFHTWAVEVHPSVIQMKYYCSRVLPGYMSPDLFHVLPNILSTSTGKLTTGVYRSWHMDFSLSNDQRNLRDKIYSFAKSELNDGVRSRDREKVFPHDLWLKCGDMTLQGLPVPIDYGGLGLDALSTALALEALGHGCEDGGLVFAICAHMLASVVPICLHGSEAQKRQLLPSLSTGLLIAVNAMTEPGSGSDAFAMKTRAVSEGEDFIITGSKTFISNGPVADLAVVYAATDPRKGFLGGVTTFLVGKEAPASRRGKHSRQWACGHARLANCNSTACEWENRRCWAQLGAVAHICSIDGMGARLPRRRPCRRDGTAS